MAGSYGWLIVPALRPWSSAPRSNRARYNAEKVVAAFSGRLRRSLDLATMQDDLASAVQLAFQPVRISVWLPPGAAAEPRPPRAPLTPARPVTLPERCTGNVCPSPLAG
jgi:hypothetical protein